MVRETAVAGQFYNGTREGLLKEIESCFFHEKGPGDLPLKRSERKITSVIVPHAGYPYSGPCAAWAYKEIAESKFYKTIILLGPNHFSSGSGMSIEDWKTPLGLVKVDKDFVIGLKENTELKIKEQHHIAEHSLEVQIPFLQYTTKENINDLRIVPIVISNDIDFVKLGKDMMNYIKKSNKEVLIIVSTDFTHYGKHYGYIPFSTDIPKRITELDSEALEFINNFDTHGFKEFINKTGITICGFMPLLVFLSMFEEEKPKHELLMHYMSGDLTGDYSNSVSYISQIFR